jgi:ABC-type dipeptide/oligopeptide/nickel transport system ATPase component
LDVRGLHTHFVTGAGMVRAVDGVSFTVESGETVAIVGESGAGKSVGAMSILRLIPDPPGRVTQGEILFAGRDLLRLSAEEMRQVRGGDIGMIFQEPMTSLNPVLTTGRQITETLEQHRGADRAEVTEEVPVQLLTEGATRDAEPPLEVRQLVPVHVQQPHAAQEQHDHPWPTPAQVGERLEKTAQGAASGPKSERLRPAWRKGVASGPDPLDQVLPQPC